MAIIIQSEINTCHSSKPCKLSGFNFLTAMTDAVVNPFLESSQPLYTFPNPPSPTTVSLLKFLVAALSSENEKTLKLGWGNICPLGLELASSLPLAAENPLFPETALLPLVDVVLLVVCDIATGKNNDFVHMIWYQVINHPTKNHKQSQVLKVQSV